MGTMTLRTSPTRVLPPTVAAATTVALDGVTVEIPAGRFTAVMPLSDSYRLAQILARQNHHFNRPEEHQP
jgi:hypothetical protein